MKSFLLIAAASIAGLYLAFVPLLRSVFPEHRSICPCHNSINVIKLRFERLASLALGD
ncbi:MAG: hypothetical protein K8S54_00975 [Spirochaetia bacterium]|nr:hypothetical protein [Spirochaetia bacterium]